MIHELKILPQYFRDVQTGKKGFEVRKFDRPLGFLFFAMLRSSKDDRCDDD